MNARHKDFDKAQARFCLAFPDVYEVGISHLGLKILYTLINNLDYAMADRAYLPWLDAIELMRQEKIPLWTLESKKPVSAFDVLGITLQSELTFTNILELLDLAGIPVRSEDRTDSHPLVIAGGPCASNPLPLSPFFDAFLIGEGEEVIAEIAELVKAAKMISPDDSADQSSAGLQQNDLLQKLAQLQGMYVPAIHDKLREKDKTFRIKIRKYAGFTANQLTHAPQLTPWQLATHNRCVAEIMRGCSRGCRFCHAGYFYRPVRERAPQDILDSLLVEVKQYGWEETGLVSLSSSDYTCIKPLLEALLLKVDRVKTHVSLPSLRVDSFDDTLIRLLSAVGREGLTIAPEAGTQRLRDVINKNLTEEEILAGVQIAKKLGWQRIKLYFMLGLPTETDADIDGIIELIGKIISEAGKRFQISVSLSSFVPKAHTPFQWSAMLPAEELLRRALQIKHAFQRCKFVKVRYHTIESSLLEAVLSRADSEAANWIEQAWKNGAVYDGWSESFCWDFWVRAASKLDYDYKRPLGKFDVNEDLPWDVIDLRIDFKWLKDEWAKAQDGITTEDCREACIGCGVCDAENSMQTARLSAELEKLEDLPEPAPKPEPGTHTRHIRSWHYRLLYAKGGDFRFIGHLDWMRMVFRIMARSGLEIVYTQGYNPHPKISFGPALAVGVTGENEYLDFHTAVNYPPESLEQALKPMFFAGLTLNKIAPMAGTAKLPQVETDELEISVHSGNQEEIEKRLKHFNKQDTFPFVKQRKDAQRHYDLRQVIISATIRNNVLSVHKLLASPNIYDLLAAIFKEDKDELYGWEIIRKGFR